MTDIQWVILISGIVLFLLSIAYIAMLAVSSKKIIAEQQSKLIEIQKNEERYKALFDNTVVGMVKFALHEWRVLNVNQSLLEKLELTTQEEFQNIFHSLMNHNEKKIAESLRNYRSFQDCELYYKTKSGKHLTFLFYGKEDTSDHNIHSVFIDVTEKIRLEETFIRAQKMEALSILTSSIAHDLQNIFAPIHLSLKLLEKQVRTQRGKMILKATKNSAKEGQYLVSNILSIAKGVKKEFKQLHLNNLFRSILHSFHPGKSIKVEYLNLVKKSDVLINGNEHQLKQMFLNILRNSKEAIQKNGSITVKIEDDPKHTFVKISITDTGFGIPSDSIQKVFEPFYSTKKNSGGTGLGLSMVAEIAKQHSGSVSINSKENIGTTIVVTLPISQ